MTCEIYPELVSPLRVEPRSWAYQSLHTGSNGGFTPCEALLRRVAGVSEPWMAYFPPIGDGEAGT